MIADGLRELCDVLKRSIRVTSLGNHGPRHMLFDVDGKLVEHAMKPGARAHRVQTIESLARSVKRIVGDVEGDPSATVWVSLESVVSVLDDWSEGHRIDTVTLPLSPSPMFGTLEYLSSARLEQKELVRMIAHDFAPADVSPDGFDLSVQKLKFETHDELEGEHKPSGDRMGREVRSKVTGESELPERVHFEFDPYPALSDELDGTVTVMCSLRALAAERLLQLCPLPGELEAAQVNATSIVRKRVEDEFSLAYSVFCGSP